MSKKLTVYGLAKELGLSVTTVSFVLNGRGPQYHIAPETIARVQEAARNMNYVPNAMARGLRELKSRIVGIVFPHLRRDWAHHIMTGIYDVLNRFEYTPFIINHGESSEQEARQVESLLERRTDAFIINPLKQSVELYQRIIHLGLPLVFLSDTLKEMPEVNYVTWDPDEAGIAIRHLIDVGCVKIAYLGILDDRPTAERRLQVFKETLRSAGLEVRPEWIILTGTGAEMGDAIAALFAPGKERPDGIFGVYDDCAMTAMDTLRSLGIKIPDEVAVATLSDSQLAGKSGYDLTTVRVPIENEGRAAARMAMQVLQGEVVTPSPVFVSGGELIPRGSTRR